MISSADLAHYGVSRAKDWVSVDCGTSFIFAYIGFKWTYTTFAKICTLPQNRFVQGVDVYYDLNAIFSFNSFKVHVTDPFSLEKNETEMKNHKNVVNYF